MGAEYKVANRAALCENAAAALSKANMYVMIERRKMGKRPAFTGNHIELESVTAFKADKPEEERMNQRITTGEAFTNIFWVSLQIWRATSMKNSQ